MPPPRLILSVVMPAYNEGAIIEQAVAEVIREISGRLDGVELVIVDDHSSDDTAGILDRLAAGDASLRIHHAPVNRGHGPSVYEAIERSRGEWILQIDSDGEIDPADLWRLWSQRSRGDLISGHRTGRHDARHRLVLSWLTRGLVRRLAGRPVLDVNAPFKLIRRELWEDLRAVIPPEAVVPSIMLILGAAVRGYRIVQIPVVHRPRLGGESTLRPWRLAKLSGRAAVELAVMRLRLSRRSVLTHGASPAPPAGAATGPGGAPALRVARRPPGALEDERGPAA